MPPNPALSLRLFFFLAALAGGATPENSFGGIASKPEVKRLRQAIDAKGANLKDSAHRPGPKNIVVD
jgi:hypothetical protein